MVHAVAFLPDGRVVAGGAGNFVTFWSARTGRFLGATTRGRSGASHSSPTPAGDLLTGHGDRTVRGWTLPPL